MRRALFGTCQRKRMSDGRALHTRLQRRACSCLCHDRADRASTHPPRSAVLPAPSLPAAAPAARSRRRGQRVRRSAGAARPASTAATALTMTSLLSNAPACARGRCVFVRMAPTAATARPCALTAFAPVVAHVPLVSVCTPIGESATVSWQRVRTRLDTPELGDVPLVKRAATASIQHTARLRRREPAQHVLERAAECGRPIVPSLRTRPAERSRE
jgi:hypothetical protein